MLALRNSAPAIAVLILVMAACIGFGVYQAVNLAVSNAIQRDGEIRINRLAAYINDRLPELEEIVKTGNPTPAQLQKFAVMRELGNVFLVKLFSPDGKLIMITGESSASVGGDYIGRISAPAREAFQTGKNQLAVKNGKAEANRPDNYIQSYQRALGADGQPVGIFELFVDQTNMVTFLQAIFGWAAAGLALLGALAYLIPAFAFMRRNADATRAEDTISYLIEFDPLTTLMSRHSFTERLDKALARPYSYLSTDAIVFIDIDNFKAINDEFGHEGGDRFMVHIAEAIKSHLPEDAYAARFGGDEFTISLPGISETRLRKICDKILSAARQPARYENQMITGQISIGAHICHREAGSKELLRAADIALYNAKNAGKNRFVLFSENMAEQMKSRRDLERLLQATHERCEFELNYQPIIDRKTLKIAGFEALLRLPDGNGGYVSPEEFIPVAESIGMIAPISKWAIHEALSTAGTWPGKLFVAVNLSPRQFEDGNLVETIRTAVEQTGFPANRLELEVTESLLLGNTASVDAQIEELKRLGSSIALDDFGTGYSSISYLIHYGFDKLKIDRSFLLAHDKDPDKLHSVLETIVSLGHGLGMCVTAEGIETPEQATMLAELHCDQFQGYHFGKPMDREEVALVLLRSTKDTMAACKPALPKLASVNGKCAAR